MRKFALALLISLIAFSAYAFDIDLKAGQFIYNSKDIKSGNSYALQMGHKDFYGAIEQDNLLLFGQWISLDSISVGYKPQLIKHLKGYVQVGYYIPQYNRTGFGSEALYYKQNELYGLPWQTNLNPYQPAYTCDIASSFGGEIGLEANMPIYKGLSVNFAIGYRYLKLNEKIFSWSAPGIMGNIVQYNSDWAGDSIMIGVEYRF